MFFSNPKYKGSPQDPSTKKNQDGVSGYFLSWRASYFHTELKERDSVIEKEKYEFSMEHGHDGLVSRCPDSIPRAIERVRNSRAQHVVQVHFSDLEEQEKRWIFLQNKISLYSLTTICSTPRKVVIVPVLKYLFIKSIYHYP